MITFKTIALLVFLTLVFSPVSISAQSTERLHSINMSYGGVGKDGLRAMIALRDGGYILGGWLDQQKPGHVGKGYLVNVSSQGHIRWDKTILTNGENRVSNVIEIDNGKIVIVVEEYPIDTDPGQAVIMLLSSEGNIEQEVKIGGEGPDLIEVMRPTPDGGYMLAGESASHANGDYQGWIAKLSPRFEVEWQHRIGEPNSPDVLQDLTMLDDGSVVGVGMLMKHSTNPEKPARPWIVKINPGGKLEWSRVVETENLFALRGIARAPNNQLAVAGYTRDWKLNEHNSWVGGLSPEGSVIWGRELRHDGYDILSALEPSNNGKFIAIGTVKGQTTDYDPLLVSFSFDGCEIKKNILETSGRQFGRVVRPLDNGTVSIGGFDIQEGPMGQQLWLLVTDFYHERSPISTSSNGHNPCKQTFIN